MDPTTHSILSRLQALVENCLSQQSSIRQVLDQNVAAIAEIRAALDKKENKENSTTTAQSNNIASSATGVLPCGSPPIDGPLDSRSQFALWWKKPRERLREPVDFQPDHSSTSSPPPFSIKKKPERKFWLETLKRTLNPMDEIFLPPPSVLHGASIHKSHLDEIFYYLATLKDSTGARCFPGLTRELFIDQLKRIRQRQAEMGKTRLKTEKTRKTENKRERSPGGESTSSSTFSSDKEKQTKRAKKGKSHGQQTSEEGSAKPIPESSGKARGEEGK